MDEHIVWKTGIQQNTDKLQGDYTRNFEELKELFTGKLRLEAPTKYGQSLAKSYDASGKKWKIGAVTTSALMLHLWQTAEVVVLLKVAIKGE